MSVLRLPDEEDAISASAQDVFACVIAVLIFVSIYLLTIEGRPDESAQLPDKVARQWTVIAEYSAGLHGDLIDSYEANTNNISYFDTWIDDSGRGAIVLRIYSTDIGEACLDIVPNTLGGDLKLTILGPGGADIYDSSEGTPLEKMDLVLAEISAELKDNNRHCEDYF